MTTAATIPHVLGEATLGELAQGLRGQRVRPEDDGDDESRAIETAANQSDATAFFCASDHRGMAMTVDPRNDGDGQRRWIRGG